MTLILDLVALLLTLSAAFGWLNRRFIRLPHAIGLLSMSLLAALLLIALETVFPGQKIYEQLAALVRQIDFTDLVMNGMLAFLLFAGALQVDFSTLRARAWPICARAILGTVISAAIVGGAFWAAAAAIGIAMPLAWAMLFGALISPTDPVAVLSMLKNADAPRDLEMDMQGEALFNDGVGIVMFSIIGTWAAGGADTISFAGVVHFLALEALGGIALGIVTGYLAYRAIRSIDDFTTEVLITLALVAGTYAIAQRIEVSGALAVVAAGILVGYRTAGEAMSDRTQNYVAALWTLIDQVLNSVLFLLIGLEVVVLRFDPGTLGLATLAIPIALAARFFAVSIPLLILPWIGRLTVRPLPFLVWAGVRGGISVALALAAPEGPAKPAILTATFAVVIFSIIVQGSTLGWLTRRSFPEGVDGPNEHRLPERSPRLLDDRLPQ